MLTLFKQFIEHQAKALHGAQGGAVILLVLAAFLILTLSTMMMFDAGVSAHNKMEIQTAADTAAYSQAVIKARSMNMISYTNTAKRVFYGYVYTYFAAWEALMASRLVYKAQCFKWLPDPNACVRWGVGLAQILVQGVELFISDIPLMKRAAAEVETLDNYQTYMVGITPGWGYAENLVRGSYNGATITAAWPAPPATIPSVISIVNDVLSFVDTFAGTTLIADYMPDFGLQTDDSLPIEKRGGGSGALAHTGYCAEFFGTPEHLLPAAEHVAQSDSGMKGISRDGQTLALFFGAAMAVVPNCIIASFVLGDNVLDWSVSTLSRPSPDEWMQNTSNLTLAYQAGAHRGENRAQMDFANLNDHNELSIFEADGYWSLARSEIVYTDSIIASAGNNLIPGLGSLGSRLTGGVVNGIMKRPNMWAPQWTSRLRPVHLPKQSLGTSARGNEFGMIPILLDIAPYMAVTGSVAGLIDSNFSFESAFRDIMFIYLASAGYNGERLQGLAQ